MNDVSCQLKHTYAEEVISKNGNVWCFTHMDNRMSSIYVCGYDVRIRDRYEYDLIRREKREIWQINK